MKYLPDDQGTGYLGLVRGLNEEFNIISFKPLVKPSVSSVISSRGISTNPCPVNISGDSMDPIISPLGKDRSLSMKSPPFGQDFRDLGFV